MKNCVKKSFFVLLLVFFVFAFGFSSCSESDGPDHAPLIRDMNFALNETDMNNKIFVTSAAKGSKVCCRIHTTDEGMDEKFCYATWTCGNTVLTQKSGFTKTENRTWVKSAWTGTRTLPSTAGTWTVTIQVEDETGALSNKLSKTLTLY